jgi:2-methylcitrate dehydratase PrpD
LVAQCDFSLAAKDFGQTWEVLNTAIKPYPACHFTHACVDAAINLREQGVKPEDVVEIEALVPAEVVKVVCEPEESKKKPANSYEAQFSIPYLVACGLTLGKLTLAELEEPALTDATILALAQKVRYSTDPNSPFPRAYSGEVRARLKDGRTLTVREEINRGAPDRPLSDADILAKFRANAAGSVNPAAASRIEAAILGLDDCTDVKASARALAG